MQAVAPLAMTALQAGPTYISETLEQQADAVNLPRIGCVKNCAFPTVQLNIASTKEASENAGRHVYHLFEYSLMFCQRANFKTTLVPWQACM